MIRTNKRISQLSIDYVTAEHAGLYTCLARNKAGYANYSTSLHVNGYCWHFLVYMAFFLYVLCLFSLQALVFYILVNGCAFAVPPQIGTFEFTDNPINAGDMTSVFCTVSKGDFPIDITWMLNGRAITDYAGISVARTNKRISQLSIDSVQAEHAGEYVCTARNAVGFTNHSTNLHVNGTHEKLW